MRKLALEKTLQRDFPQPFYADALDISKLCHDFHSVVPDPSEFQKLMCRRGTGGEDVCTAAMRSVMQISLSSRHFFRGGGLQNHIIAHRTIKGDSR